jgi:hypothetical protein
MPANEILTCRAQEQKRDGAYGASMCRETGRMPFGSRQRYDAVLLKTLGNAIEGFRYSGKCIIHCGQPTRSHLRLQEAQHVPERLAVLCLELCRHGPPNGRNVLCRHVSCPE